MSPRDDKPISLEERRSRLERRANVIRSRLLRTIDALDERRHQVTQLGHQAKRLAGPVGGALLGAAIIAAGAAFAISRILKARRERNLEFRVTRFIDRFRREDRPSFMEEALRKVALTVLGIAASELAKRSTKNVLDGRFPGGGRLLPAGPTDGSAIVVR